MDRLLSFVADPISMQAFKSEKDFCHYISQLGLDGIELIRCGAEDNVPESMIKGIHLPYNISWMDYWLGNKEELYKEYQTKEIIQTFFRYEPHEYWKTFVEDLEYNRGVADYGVFHVSNVRMAEYMSQNYAYSSDEVIDQSACLINQILEKSPSQKRILLENLYSPGLTFTSAQQTNRLFEQITSERVGIVLDTGHLMCTAKSLEDEDEAWEYVKKMLKRQGSMISKIEAIHLNVSLPSITRQVFHQEEEKDFWLRFKQLYEVMAQVDQHAWVTSKKALEVIEMIEPKTLVFEYRGVSPKNGRQFYEKTRWIQGK